MRLFINLTPLIPLSFSRRGGRDFREGQSPSLTYTPPSLIKGRGVRGIGCETTFIGYWLLLLMS